MLIDFKKNKILFFLLIAVFLLPIGVKAFNGKAKETYPRLANYYLKWEIPNNEIEKLARWDVLILDMETENNSRDELKKIRQLNNDIIMLSYITSEEIKYDSWNSSNARLRSDLFSRIDDSWWLKDKNGNKLSFWPGTNLLNLTDGAGIANGKRWNQVLPEFVKNEIISTGLWDGVFYDNVWPTISWFNSGNLDIDRNCQILSSSQIDKKWQEGNIKMLSYTQELFRNNYLVVVNSHAFDGYQPYLNGIMLENFPPPWEASGTWAGGMNAYSRDKSFKTPKIMVVNANTNNTWQMENYRKMRFSLGSVLLGDGYFSFDYGDQNHSQTWWYDEYDVSLGKAISEPYNILDKNNPNFKQGVWRRDFENGIVVVNSTKENKNYAFTNEQFEKINGTQDRRINNGSRINMVSMLGEDAIVLLGSPIVVGGQTNENLQQGEVIREAGFNNGSFIRVFNREGKQVKNGFFTYSDNYPAGSQVLISDLDNDGINEDLVNYQGIISIYRNKKLILSFKPYDGKFKGNISFAVADLNGDFTKEIITGAGSGGGPHVRVFDKEGKPLIGGFFAYNEKFRGGVDVAVIDLNGDGTKEIITSPGSGGGPHVRIFTKDGRSLTGGFFAYNTGFRGGVSIAVGNIDGQGEKEIITGAGPGGSPEVRVYSKDGSLLNKFFAYDEDDYSGIRVIAADLDNDGTDEILANSLGY